MSINTVLLKSQDVWKILIYLIFTHLNGGKKFVNGVSRKFLTLTFQLVGAKIVDKPRKTPMYINFRLFIL